MLKDNPRSLPAPCREGVFRMTYTYHNEVIFITSISFFDFVFLLFHSIVLDDSTTNCILNIDNEHPARMIWMLKYFYPLIHVRLALVPVTLLRYHDTRIIRWVYSVCQYRFLKLFIIPG